MFPGPLYSSGLCEHLLDHHWSTNLSPHPFLCEQNHLPAAPSDISLQPSMLSAEQEAKELEKDPEAKEALLPHQ